MIPAQQGLDAQDRAARKTDDRLIVDLELAAIARVAQLVLELAPRLRGRVHLRLEQAEIVAPLGLDPIEREIGIVEQLLGFRRVVRARDADAGADRGLRGAESVRRADTSTMRCAKASALARLSVETCRIANSSPPSRATVSISRTQLRSRCAT